MHAMKQGLAAFVTAALILMWAGSPGVALAQQAGPAAPPSAVTSAPASPAPAIPAQAAPANNSSPAAASQLPDSPGASAPSSAQPTATPPASGQASSSQATQTPGARPPGTAAAEISNTGGVTASEPAGFAIAPAKQHRVRSWVIRLGVMAGAGVAVGTALALSQASPSKPPGAH